MNYVMIKMLCKGRTATNRYPNSTVSYEAGDILTVEPYISDAMIANGKAVEYSDKRKRVETPVAGVTHTNANRPLQIKGMPKWLKSFF